MFYLFSLITCNELAIQKRIVMIAIIYMFGSISEIIVYKVKNPRNIAILLIFVLVKSLEKNFNTTLLVIYLLLSLSYLWQLIGIKVNFERKAPFG